MAFNQLLLQTLTKQIYKINLKDRIEKYGISQKTETKAQAKNGGQPLIETVIH